MDELTERQKLILTLVVRDYIETAKPVGSKILIEHYKLDMSSATIRNEMAALTEAGYLRQPHTSAGRVPTEEGYRYFVTHFVYQTDLPNATRDTITHQFYQARQDVEQWMHLAASILAHQSRAASLITAPHASRARYKHLELISTQGRQVLMVLVLVGGEVSQQILTLAEPVSQDQLSDAANRLNQVCQSRTTEELASLTLSGDALEKDILTLVMQDMNRGEQRVSGEIYLDGLTNVLSEPEFIESDDARRAIRLFEERSLLQDLLARTMVNSHVGGVQVLIGGEGEWEELKQCSVVLARYGIPGMATGALGVFGPMRMPYTRTIPTVRFMADLLSGLVSETMVGDESQQ
ncbi:MAG: heat-inducible transcription repressor HrcA [Anaerolineae bacterium CG17_big_fil_post_rev_8_21_14_2_50_57_27]|nr:MAG: heat-inducible transcription repressor HrcA [Anaerolineae bacterium CG17_big_fil_post_rev_8_21_14_2_50_57_27]PJH75292.1 MAG: heat-inducible transcription repressor HrcA [Anaerolineae bacterium CG_4_9_14_0_8_um_filter_58_9]